MLSKPDRRSAGKAELDIEESARKMHGRLVLDESPKQSGDGDPSDATRSPSASSPEQTHSADRQSPQHGGSRITLKLEEPSLQAESQTPQGPSTASRNKHATAVTAATPGRQPTTVEPVPEEKQSELDDARNLSETRRHEARAPPKSKPLSVALVKTLRVLSFVCAVGACLAALALLVTIGAGAAHTYHVAHSCVNHLEAFQQLHPADPSKLAFSSAAATINATTNALLSAHHTLQADICEYLQVQASFIQAHPVLGITQTLVCATDTLGSRSLCDKLEQHLILDFHKGWWIPVWLRRGTQSLSAGKHAWAVLDFLAPLCDTATDPSPSDPLCAAHVAPNLLFATRIGECDALIARAKAHSAHLLQAVSRQTAEHHEVPRDEDTTSSSSPPVQQAQDNQDTTTEPAKQDREEEEEEEEDVATAGSSNQSTYTFHAENSPPATTVARDSKSQLDGEEHDDEEDEEEEEEEEDEGL
jgi:hypothetical protein